MVGVYKREIYELLRFKYLNRKETSPVQGRVVISELSSGTVWVLIKSTWLEFGIPPVTRIIHVIITLFHQSREMNTIHQFFNRYKSHRLQVESE